MTTALNNGGTMSDNQNTVETAIKEIRRLRRENELLSAKVEVMDLFACVLHTKPASNTQGYGEDVAWHLQKMLDEMKVEPE